MPPGRSSPPPPTPPKESNALLASPSSIPKRKSPSFSNLLRPSSILSDDGRSASSAGGSSSATTEKDGSKLSFKVKEFFNKDKKQPAIPAATTSSDNAGGSGSATPSTVTTSKPSIPTKDAASTTVAPTNALQIAISDNDAALFRFSSSTGQPVTTMASQAAPSGTDQSKRAVQSAQTSVDRMETASVWLGFAAQGLSAAGAWLPMIGHGVQAVVTMLEMAKEIGIAKVAALRLVGSQNKNREEGVKLTFQVERCADILQAVLNKLKSQNGHVSLDMRQDINRLLTNVHNTAFLLTKLANRPFFKLWLHAGEVQDQIAEATAEIDVFFNIFHVEAAMTTNALLEQAKMDREADQTILRDMIQAGIRDEAVLLNMLIKKSEEQQEAIKTLQRALDNLRYEQAHDPALAHSPTGSPDIHPASRIARLVESPASLTIGLPAPTSLWLPDSQVISSTRQSSVASWRSGGTDTSHLSVQAQVSDSLEDDVIRGSSMHGEMGEGRVTAGAPGAMDPEATVNANLRVLAARSEAVDPRRQFIERALDVLRRHSASTDYGVPDWTITSLEVTHELRLATSFFSTIWRGKWQGELVAIKELHRNIDRSLFITEVEVWRRLRSKHVLPFFGASSTTGPPPWFMVSPFSKSSYWDSADPAVKNGNILTFFRTAKWSSSERRYNTLCLVREMAEGMEYLHSRDIIHGDFKATNVLVSDAGDALICDFGLSQLKSDLTRRSQEDPEARRSVSGTMRWLSPERLSGKPLTTACDVYAFGITVCELYSAAEGESAPFGYIDDSLVRQKIIRPLKPARMPKALWAVVQRCWTQEAAERPTFEAVVQQIIKIAEANKEHSKSIHTESPSTSTSSFETAPETMEVEEQHALSPQIAQRALLDDDGVSSSSGSIRSIPTHLAREISFESDRAERHYRHYLTHEFDDRLTIPLWFPSEIPLGSVGYIRHGQFVKLLDANRPSPEVAELPPVLKLDEFDSLMTQKAAVNVQNVADKGWEMVHSAWMNFIKSSGEKSQRAISKQYAFPLKPGGKQAVLLVDDGDFEIYKSFTEARSYLTGNIDWILKYFADSHHINKEDVIIVVGTLSAHNYAMAVSKFAPKTTLMFNVHTESQRKAGEAWGTWTVNRQRGADEPDLQYICKVSTVSGSPRDTVLLAKLKFPPGGGEPALYP